MKVYKILISLIIGVVLFSNEINAQTITGNIFCADEELQSDIKKYVNQYFIDNGFYVGIVDGKRKDFIYTIYISYVHDDDCNKFFLYYVIEIDNNLGGMDYSNSSHVLNSNFFEMYETLKEKLELDIKVYRFILKAEK